MVTRREREKERERESQASFVTLTRGPVGVHVDLLSVGNFLI